MFVSEIIQDVFETLGIDDLPRALGRLSKAVQALQDEGDWNANIGAVDIRAHKDLRTITLPPEVETPLAVSVDGQPVFMRDEFYKFHLNGEGLADCQGPGGRRIAHSHCSWAWDDKGAVPSFLDIITAGELIAIAEKNTDIGQMIRVMGLADTGRKLRQQLEDGSWIDGTQVETKSIADFSGGIITQPGLQEFRRQFVITPMTTFSSVTKHELATGAYMQVALQSGTVPEPVLDGAYYYIRINTDYSITLHKTRLDSRTGQSPIELVKTTAGSVLRFTDSRTMKTRTQFQTSTVSNLLDYDLVTFFGTALPVALDSTLTYFVRVNGTDKFSIFGTLADAQAFANVINVSTPGTAVKIRALKTATPVTTLNFTVNHNFVTNDSVTVENSGGQIPTPLILGANYFVHVIDARTITLHVNLADAGTGVNPIALTSLGSGTNSVVKALPASASVGNTSNITAPNHNLNTPTGSGAIVKGVVTAGNITSYTVTNGGSGYQVAPIIKVLGAGTGATAQANVAGGVVVSVTPITLGTGYSGSVPTTVTGAAGSFVRFSSTGTLPDPITQGTVYRAEAPMTGNTFTLNDTVPAPITISGTGTGSLFLLISRTFSVGFLPQFQTQAQYYATGQGIQFFTQGVLPSASPTVDQTLTYYLRKLSDTTVEVYITQAQALNLASTTGRIIITSLGVGQLYFSTQKSVTAIPRDNFLELEFSGYLQNFADIIFSTDGTLPAPLVPGNPYQASIVDGLLQVLNPDNTTVTLTDIGSGNHQMIIRRDLSVDLSNSLVVVNQQYDDGDVVTALSDETLPTPLVAGTNYYVRRNGDDSIELFDTLSHALAIGSETGRLVYLSTGEGIHRLIQMVIPPKVAEVYQIEKPLSDGYITLYVWDIGRDGNLTLLGDIAPNITNPSYRRIQVTKHSSWVRMMYRRRSIVVNSERDFINLDSAMAVLMMVKSHDLLIKNFVDEAERYRVNAVEFLNKRNRALDGPRAPTLQFNADVMTCPDDHLE